MILLDTHAWLWLANADKRLSLEARQAIREASVLSALYVSPISMWEIALKHSRGRLELGFPLRTWMNRAINGPGMHIAAINPEIACACAELPGEFHGDPADRIIAATARAEGFTLVTHDEKLLYLAKQGYFHALAT